MGFKVCLVIPNQWATGRQRKEDLEGYYKRVRLSGLKINEEVIFTSEWRDEFDTGIPRRMLRELMLMSNLFIFPTREESFGLVCPEAAMCGLEMVLNRSLPMMFEVGGGCGIYAEFGSFEKPLQTPGSEADYYKALAHLIIGRMRRSEVIACKTFHRQKYNWNHLYERYYLPAFGESDVWTTLLTVGVSAILAASSFLGKYSTGKYSQDKLAEIFNTSSSNVGCIIRRETWI